MCEGGNQTLKKNFLTCLATISVFREVMSHGLNEHNKKDNVHVNLTLRRVGVTIFCCGIATNIKNSMQGCSLGYLACNLNAPS